jgi:hypothetical protein
MPRPTHALRRSPLLALAGCLSLAAATFAISPAQAGSEGSDGSDDSPSVVASNLNSPRLLAFDEDGNLYVAEAGSGGSGPCVTGGEGKPVCLGATGSITKIHHDWAKRVVTGLPSLAGTNGDEPIGPEGVLPDDEGNLVISMGAGIDANQRATLGRAGRYLGTLLSVEPRNHHHHDSGDRREGRHDKKVIADIAAFELANNPDGSKAHDSDPAGFLSKHHGYVLADAGGNDLLGIRHHDIQTLAVFPDTTVAIPPQFGGGTGPMQAVPTAVAIGPDHALYVSQLTGFPFPVGAANIWRVVPGQTPTKYATGLTNVTDLAWHHDQLYAVQIADGGLLAATGLPTGSLLRVHAGDNSTPDAVVSNLPAPYGVAIHHHSAYVTSCTVCAGGGTVVKVPLS